jgi:hypothetical protein
MLLTSSMIRPSTFLKCVFFACLGVTTEVCFSALSDLLFASSTALKGHTYMWVLPLYALIPIVSPYFKRLTTTFSLLEKYGAAGLIFITIEFAGAAVLHLVLGHCPWEYQHGIHLFGFTRLDYYPFWVCAAIVAEHLDDRLHICYKR